MIQPDGSDELSFLTHLPPLFGNNNDRDTIWGHLHGKPPSDADIKNPKRVIVFKNGKNIASGITNYYKEKIYSKTTLNPYSELISDFNMKNKAFRAVSLNASDFSYLTNLGIYPINRLWILRRFKEGVMVPDNLLDWGKNTEIPLPMSTVIGWIPQDASNFFNITFNETWKTQTDRIDQVIAKMVSEEFNLPIKSTMPVPGWSQGLLMGFLNEMGDDKALTNFDYNNIPFGNPDVLQEAATRVTDPKDAYGINSSMVLDLKTSYEQKFIGNVDSGSAMLDIIRNLTMMGTSDMLFFLNNNSTTLDALRNASQKGSDVQAWVEFVGKLINVFLKAISSLIEDIKDIPTKPIGDTMTDAMETILASTVSKWKWPLKGGIGVLTGENTTPWHLTIGNPYSPFVSMGNIKVDNVSLDFNNQIGFNDMPTKLEANIKVSLGRNKGGQEIFAMFNNGYKRAYDTENSEYISMAHIQKNSDVKEKGKK